MGKWGGRGGKGGLVGGVWGERRRRGRSDVEGVGLLGFGVVACFYETRGRR